MPQSIENKTTSNSLHVTLTDRHSRSDSRCNRREVLKLHELKAVVEKAIQNNKTFTVLGPFSCIKNALKLRGWIEKFDNTLQPDDRKAEKSVLQGGNTGSSSGSVDKRFGLTNDSTLEEIQVSRLLRDYSVDFVWTMKNESIKWKKLSFKMIISRFPRADFTTKAGLCNSLQQPYWFHEKGVSVILLPRCYNISQEEELSAFIENFRLTACISLIRLIHETGDTNIISKEGTIPPSTIEFALQRCNEYVSSQQHKDIDCVDPEKVWDHQWDQFLTYYYQAVHDRAVFASNNEDDLQVTKEKCAQVLQQLRDHWSQLHLDGTKNLWILKPAAKSRGRGILIMKKLEDILAKTGSVHSKEYRFVAQKYIEKPLLIYETKFDIRQWFLVTSAYPLTIWMYKESYLRFCSQIFSLTNIHESVHLSNNAVQCKYRNGKRDKNLPDENMWDCYTFQTYLRSKGRPEVWNSIIYPGMRQNIIGTLLASQDTLDTRKNCFELFGADFMLSENFEPWLIEINSGPSMSASTSVTARMCAQVLNDVIKVVIDRKNDKNASTGMFELVYKQIIPPTQPYTGQNLTVRGVKIEHSKTKYKRNPANLKKQKCSHIIGLPSKVLRDRFTYIENCSEKRALSAFLMSTNEKSASNDERISHKFEDSLKENMNQRADMCIKSQIMNQLNAGHSTILNNLENFIISNTDEDDEVEKTKSKDDKDQHFQLPLVNERTKQNKYDSMLSIKRSAGNSNTFPQINDNKIAPGATEWKCEMLNVI